MFSHESMKYRAGDMLQNLSGKKAMIVERGGLRWLLNEWLGRKDVKIVKSEFYHNDRQGGYVVRYENGDHEIVASWFADEKWKQAR